MYVSICLLLSMRFCLEKNKKKTTKIEQKQARPRHPENSKRVAIFFRVPRDPLPAVRWDEKVRTRVISIEHPVWGLLRSPNNVSMYIGMSANNSASEASHYFS